MEDQQRTLDLMLQLWAMHADRWGGEGGWEPSDSDHNEMEGLDEEDGELE